ncbi:MAG: Ig-like domain-containing protein, partial [Gemmatimonadales bacterium]
MFKFYRSALAAGVVALGLAACGDNVTVQPPPPPSGGGVTAVNVTPANATVGVGQTIQLAASVIADSGVSTALNWTSSNAAIATVSASGLVTGVGLGTTTVIATSVASPSHSSAAQVTVTNAATFSISPTTMQLAPGQSSSATATVALQAGQTATAIVWTSLTPAIATVSSSCTTTAGTSVCPITGVSQGSAVITATTTVAGQTFSQTLSVSVGAGASLSINSVTAGATADEFSGCIGTVGAPVILTDVNCQIDVNLNFSPGIQRIDSITVWFQQGTTIKRLARQFYGATIPSGGIVTLSVNTANFTKTPTTGIATVDLWNGPTTMIAQVWPTVGTGGTAIDCQIGAGNPNPTCSNLGIVLNNADGWAADLTKCSGIIATGVVCPAAVPAIGPGGANASTGGFAVSTQSNPGTTYWGGPSTQGEITAELYAVVYNNNPGFPAGSALNRCASTAGAGADCITNVSWAIGSTTLT